MKKTVIFISALFVCSAVLNAREVIDKTLAIVNSEHIMMSDFKKVADPIMEQYKQSAPKEELTDEKIKEAKEKILEQMVDDKLILQKAKSEKIKVSKRELEININKIKDNFKSEDEFSDALKKENLTQSQFEDRIRDQTMQIKLIDLEVRSKIEQSDEKETKELYDKVKSVIDGKELAQGTTEEIKNIKDIADFVKKNFSELVRARHILMRISKNQSMVEQLAVKKKLQDIKKKLDSGKILVIWRRNIPKIPAVLNRAVT